MSNKYLRKVIRGAVDSDYGVVHLIKPKGSDITHFAVEGFDLTKVEQLPISNKTISLIAFVEHDAIFDIMNKLKYSQLKIVFINKGLSVTFKDAVTDEDLFVALAGYDEKGNYFIEDSYSGKAHANPVIGLSQIKKCGIIQRNKRVSLNCSSPLGTIIAMQTAFNNRSSLEVSYDEQTFKLSSNGELDLNCQGAEMYEFLYKVLIPTICREEEPSVRLSFKEISHGVEVTMEATSANQFLGTTIIDSGRIIDINVHESSHLATLSKVSIFG